MNTDITLVRGCLGGDRRAFETIVSRYQALVCAITYSAVGHQDVSEELAQETFVQAWKQMDQLREPDKFRPWLCSIARSIVCNYLRAQERKPIVFCDLKGMTSSANTETPPDTLIRHEEEEMIRRALMQIPEEYRQPLVLFYRQDQSTQQVAEIMGLTEGAVRTRLHRGRQMLREEVESRIETTLRKTAPGAAFTRSVMGAMGVGLVAGITGTATAAGVGNAAEGLLASVQAKVIAAAAVAVIGTGTVVTYHHFSNPQPTIDTAVIESKENPWATQRGVYAQPVRTALAEENIVSIEAPSESPSVISQGGSEPVDSVDADSADDFDAWFESLFAKTSPADGPLEKSSEAVVSTGGARRSEDGVMGGGMVGGMGGGMMGGMGMGGYRYESGEDGSPILPEDIPIPDETEDGEP